MSDSEIEIVRRALEAFSRGALQSALTDCAPDVVFDWSRSAGLEAGLYMGRPAAERFLATFHEVFERVCTEPQELIERGENLIMPVRTRLWGREGIEVQTRHVSVVRIHNGQIVLWRLYQDRDEALRDVAVGG